MKPQKAFWWLLFLTFATGFIYGQDHPDAVVIRGLFLFVMAIFVLHTLLNSITGTYAKQQEEKWKDHQSLPKKKPPSSGMARTVATVAGATGTHAIAPRTTPRSPSSGDSRAVGHKRPDAGLDG